MQEAARLAGLEEVKGAEGPRGLARLLQRQLISARKAAEQRRDAAQEHLGVASEMQRKLDYVSVICEVCLLPLLHLPPAGTHAAVSQKPLQCASV
jgi:hypothetical protein